ncbi:MAG: diphosphomevalonate decarboxylase [Bacteroidia bacterium]|jgi:diphosphomevalonate decarboxylase
MEGKVKWQSPSNIALVKYWGKKGFQIPANASISFTLSACHTNTELRWTKSDHTTISVFLDGQENEAFKPKVVQFFDQVKLQYPALSNYSFEVHTTNTFPHSSGIASSASGMSALSLCVCSLLESKKILDKPFLQEASNLARIGSGSASRSIYGGLVEWGQHTAFPESSDLYAVPFKDVHSVFHSYQDTILIVHEGKKSVSSSVGHTLLNDHPFGPKRFEQATQNMSKLKTILMEGDLDSFVELIESEALMLHGLMMTSDPSFILMLPNTLAIIQKIRAFRKQNDCHIAFTLDAGANVHMLYPEKDIDKAQQLIDRELKELCANGTYICDTVGSGPTQMEC